MVRGHIPTYRGLSNIQTYQPVFSDLQYTGILHRYPQSLRYVTIRDRYHRRYAYRPSLPTSEEAYRDDIDMRSRCGIYVVTFCCAYFGISLFISRILLHILTYCLSSGCSVNIAFPIWKYIILRILHVSQEYC